jgi:hypothetical protein
VSQRPESPTLARDIQPGEDPRTMEGRQRSVQTECEGRATQKGEQGTSPEERQKSSVPRVKLSEVRGNDTHKNVLSETK